MPIVVRLRQGTLTESASGADLYSMAAEHEVVLVGSLCLMPDGRLSPLRRALAPRRMVALLVDDHVPATERALILELLNDGIIPVLLTTYDPPQAALMSWLDAELFPVPRRYAPTLGGDRATVGVG
jgi:hypothetical protein